MLFTVTERANTREITTGRNQTYERTYVILGTPQAGDDQVDLDGAALEALAAIMRVQVPAAVYIEQVYESGNFADLGIGV